MKITDIRQWKNVKDAGVEFQVHCNSFTAAHRIMKADTQHKALVKKSLSAGKVWIFFFQRKPEHHIY